MEDSPAWLSAYFSRLTWCILSFASLLVPERTPIDVHVFCLITFPGHDLLMLKQLVRRLIARQLNNCEQQAEIHLPTIMVRVVYGKIIHQEMTICHPKWYCLDLFWWVVTTAPSNWNWDVSRTGPWCQRNLSELVTKLPTGNADPGHVFKVVKGGVFEFKTQRSGDSP